MPDKTTSELSIDKDIQQKQPKNFGIQNDNEIIEEEEDFFDEEEDKDQISLKKGEIRYS